MPAGQGRRPGILAATLLLAGLLSGGAAARAETCSAKEVTRERSETTSAGVTRSERWAERTLVCGDKLWLERIGAAPLPDTPRDRREPDLERAAWYATRLPDGKTQLWLVFRELRMVVEARPGADYDRIGFDGNFATLAGPRAEDEKVRGTRFSTRVRLLPPPKGALPWEALAGFTHKTFDELGD